MKFLHLGDLHLGKKVNDISMAESQKYVLKQAVELVENEKIDVVLIAGDVFDKSVANISALELFSDFLDNLNKLNTNVILISGNHDNIERINYLSSILKKSNIFISKIFDGTVEKIELKSNVCVYLMPYLYPSLIKKFYPDFEFSNYNDAIKKVVDSIKIDKNKINILLAHQFVSAKSAPVLSDSENKSVGGVDVVDYKIFEKFDYVALGHLHCPQKVGKNNIRYSGSILKYSFSEINQKKVFTIFEFDENKKINFIFKDIKFIHDLKEYRGYIEEFLDEKFYSKIKTDDYIHFILLDESAIDAKKALSLIYPNIMILEFDNKFTRENFSTPDDISLKNKTIFEHFCDFYKFQMNSELDFEKKQIVENILDKTKGIC